MENTTPDDLAKTTDDDITLTETELEGVSGGSRFQADDESPKSEPKFL